MSIAEKIKIFFAFVSDSNIWSFKKLQNQKMLSQDQF